MEEKAKQILAAGVALSLLIPSISVNSAAAAGWEQNGTGWWWQEDDASYPADTWKYIGGQWYYFDSAGYMLEEGWHWINGKCYYMYAGGAMAANTWIGGSYVDASGAWAADQWVFSGNGWWYQRADGSYPVNTWEIINGSWYYFDAAGWMLEEGWHWINGKCYYMYAGGAMAANTWIGDSYVDASGAWVEGTPAQWIQEGGRWWYRHGDGSYTANNWEYINGRWYYFDAGGWMQTGWINVGDFWYYLDGSGAMAANQWVGNYWVDESGKRVPSFGEDNRKPVYSYEVYSLKTYETAYPASAYMVYLKTDNPNIEDIKVEGEIIDFYPVAFDDVKYTDRNDENDVIDKVEGGYLLNLMPYASGILPVKIYEKDILVKEIEIEVVDYDAAEDREIGRILKKVTTPDMTPVEKMQEVCRYLLDTCKYPTGYRGEDGGRDGAAALLAEPHGAWWDRHKLDSASSPALLAKFAEKIGGFDNIHNCYWDYDRGTEGWYAWHYICKADYKGKTYYFEACPSASESLIDRDRVKYVSFASGSEIFGKRLG